MWLLCNELHLAPRLSSPDGLSQEFSLGFTSWGGVVTVFRFGVPVRAPLISRGD